MTPAAVRCRAGAADSGGSEAAGPAPGADSRAAPRGSRRRQWRRGCTVVERARRSRCGGQRRREVVVEGGIGGHGSRLRGRSTSLTAAVSRRLSPSSSVMPSVLRGCVRAPPRAPRVGQGVRPPAAGADAVRGPRSAASEARPGPSCTAAAPSASDVWRRCRPCTRWRHCEQRRPADGPGRERLRFCGGKRMRSSKVLPFGGTSPREGMAAWRSE